MTGKRFTVWAFSVSALAAVVAAGTIAWLSVRDDTPSQRGDASVTGNGLVGLGEYLVRAGSCEGCHTERGGARFAGGRAIETPFGIVYSSNLTPDANGLGAWTSDDFWRALHNGRSRDGHLLYPAFPYPNYTRLARGDADAMFAYLKSLAPVAAAPKPHALRFPFDQAAALAAWRALFFRPAGFQPDREQTPSWNRGAYLVETLGHCNACHSQRNAFGATAGPLDLAGGLIPVQNWYAPSLASPQEAGMGDWDRQHIVRLLRDGVAPGASVSGPMAEVVLRSTQYLSPQDLGAMAQYLKELPDALPKADTSAPERPVNASSNAEKSAKLYEQHCAQCHGDKGQGVANAYPALAGNRAITMASPENLVQMVLNGGFPPATAGNPRPFGMPPFVLVLNDSEVADVVSHIRTAWGNQASAVTQLEVGRIRGNQAR